MAELSVPIQRFSREDPLYRHDATESIIRSLLGGDIDSDLLAPERSQAGDVAATRLMTSGAKRGASTVGRGLSRGLAGVPLLGGSLVAGPLSVALGRLYRPDVSSGTITPGGPQGRQFSDISSYEGLVNELEGRERQKRLELIAAGQRLRERYGR